VAIIAIRAWYLAHYEPIAELVQRPHDLRLNKVSLLKSGLRADFLNERDEVQSATWFQRYLEGETVEFYIEGSGGYTIANIDLVSHEIYFTQQAIAAWLEPTIYLSYQGEYEPASQALRDSLESAIATLNPRSRLSLSLEESPRPRNAPMRIGASQLRRIRKCLLFVADATPVATGQHARSLPSPLPCLELGHAIQSKQPNQILLASMAREGDGQPPFELPDYKQLQFATREELQQTLPSLLESLLQRFRLFA
jgi:hypothetical protein